jgi:hypothetical protein
MRKKTLVLIGYSSPSLCTYTGLYNISYSNSNGRGIMWHQQILLLPLCHQTKYTGRKHTRHCKKIQGIAALSKNEQLNFLADQLFSVSLSLLCSLCSVLKKSIWFLLSKCSMTVLSKKIFQL